MTTFSEVLELSQTAADALNAIEETTAARVLSLFGKFENGFMTFPELRIELFRQVKTNYVTGGSVAVEHLKTITRNANLARLDVGVEDDSPVVQKLLGDMRDNLEVFRDSPRDAKALRRLRFRAGLTVQTSLRKGFSENQLVAAKELASRGVAVKKIWLANFLNGNSPCDACRKLHGAELALHEEYPHGGEHAPKVYGDLQGPPRHPNCHCYMVCYVVSLDTVVKVPAGPAIVGEERFMSSRDVRRLPRAAYVAVLATLRLIAGLLTGARRGKR